MKKVMITITALILTNLSKASEVELLQRSNRNNQNEIQGHSVYNFITKSRGDENNYSEHLMYNGTNKRDTYFEGEMVTDQFSNIVDLGKMSCKSITSKYPEYKYNWPISWLIFGQNGEDEYDVGLDFRLENKRFVRAPALVGHCYFLHFTDSNSQVMGLFHVKEINEASVIIDEMETLLVRKF